MRGVNFLSVLLVGLVLVFGGCGGTNSSLKIKDIKQVRHQQNQKILLELDTLTHRARTSDLIVTKDKRHVLTCSDDKSVLLTNIETAKVEKKYLGEIGDGFGSVYAIALSPNEKYLAVGGWFAEGGGINDDKVGWIRIYDFKTAEVLKVLKGHTNIITDLHFSEDGKYLVSSSADRTIEVRRVSDFQSLYFKSYSKYINEFRIYKNQIISIDNDWKIKIRDLETGKLISYRDVMKEINMSKKRRTPRFQYIAVNDNNIAISTGTSSDQIIILNHNLEIVKKIDIEAGASGLEYSKDGNYLIVGGGGNGKIASKKYVKIFNSHAGYKLVSQFDKFDSLVMAVGFLDKDKAIGVGGYNYNIRVWDIKSASEINNITGLGNVKPAVAFVENNVVWRNEIITLKHELDKYYDLDRMKIVNEKINIKDVKRLPLKYKQYELKKAANSYGLILYKNGKFIYTLKSSDGHKFYGFYKDYILSANNVGEINVFSLNGKLIYTLQGHKGEITSVHFNSKYIVSSGYDQTIRFWKLPLEKK